MYRSTIHIGAVGRAKQTDTNDIKEEPNTVQNPLLMDTFTKAPVEKRYPWLTELKERYFCKVNTLQGWFVINATKLRCCKLEKEILKETKNLEK